MRVVHEVVAVAFPRSVVGKDLDLNVGVFAALLATAFEKLSDIIDVLPITVGEGRQKILATSVPVQIIDLSRCADTRRCRRGMAAAGPSAPRAAARRQAPRAVRRTWLRPVRDGGFRESAS